MVETSDRQSDWQCAWNVYPTYDRNLVREISGLRFASLEMTGREVSAVRCPLTMGEKMVLRHRTHLRCEG